MFTFNTPRVAVREGVFTKQVSDITIILRRGFACLQMRSILATGAGNLLSEVSLPVSSVCNLRRNTKVITERMPAFAYVQSRASCFSGIRITPGMASNSFCNHQVASSTRSATPVVQAKCCLFKQRAAQRIYAGGEGRWIRSVMVYLVCGIRGSIPMNLRADVSRKRSLT